MGFAFLLTAFSSTAIKKIYIKKILAFVETERAPVNDDITLSKHKKVQKNAYKFVWHGFISRWMML